MMKTVMWRKKMRMRWMEKVKKKRRKKKRWTTSIQGIREDSTKMNTEYRNLRHLNRLLSSQCRSQLKEALKGPVRVQD